VTALHFFQQELYLGLGFSQRRAEQKEIFQPTRMGNIRRSLTRSKCSTRFDWSRGPLEIHHSDQKKTVD
jgi:hypothetical protein